MSLHGRLFDRKKRFFAITVLCLMLAITLRAMVPVGYMPDLKASQPFKMVVCTLNGPKTVIIDGDFNPQGHESHKDQKSENEHKAPCDFSINTAFTDNAISPIVALTDDFGIEKTTLSRISDINSLWFFGNSASRAPPAPSYV